MANPQVENGHIKIANEIVEALCQINLNPYESRVLWCIVRKTYGWNKKKDKIPVSQIVKETGLRKQHVSRALKSLIDRQIVTRTSDKQTCLQKNYDQWSPKPVTAKSNLNRLPLSPKPVTKSNLNRGTQKTIKTPPKDNKPPISPLKGGPDRKELSTIGGTNGKQQSFQGNSRTSTSRVRPGHPDYGRTETL